MMKTILVTGGSGFIGRNIVEAFASDMNILAPSHAELDLLSSETVHRYFKEHDIDYVVHCANIGGNRKNPGGWITLGKNIWMFSNISSNLSNVSRMIHLGSGAEYGKYRALENVHEREFGMAIPNDPYGLSKYVINESILKSDNIINLRLFGVYGKFEDYEYKFISNAIVRNLLGLNIRQNVVFDWLYIDDLIRVLRCFLNEKQCCWKSYNVTPGYRLDLVSIAVMINSLSRYQSRIYTNSQKMNNPYGGNNSRLRKTIGSDFKFTPIQDAIRYLLEYYEEILPTIDRHEIERDVYADRCHTIGEGIP